MFAVLVSVYCLSEDITGIFVHLYYIPILIARRTSTGSGGSCSRCFLVMVYLLLVFFHSPGDTRALVEGGGHPGSRPVGHRRDHLDPPAASAAMSRPCRGRSTGTRRSRRPCARASRATWSEHQPDDLTGLYNQRHFYNLLQADTERTERHGRPCPHVFDIDDFKRFNDAYGRTWRATGPGADRGNHPAVHPAHRLAFRHGGEEFTVFMPETERDQAEVVAERIRTESAADPVPLSSRAARGPRRSEYRITNGGEDMKDFTNCADRPGRIEAKRRGRTGSAPRPE